MYFDIYYEYEEQEKQEKQRFENKTLEERVKKYGGELRTDGEYDRGEPAGNDYW